MVIRPSPLPLNNELHMKTPLYTGLISEVGQQTTVNGVEGLLFVTDSQGNIMKCSAPKTLPTANTPGYGKGCEYTDTLGVLGTSNYINDGDATACNFISV